MATRRHDKYAGFRINALKLVHIHSKQQAFKFRLWIKKMHHLVYSLRFIAIRKIMEDF